MQFYKLQTRIAQNPTVRSQIPASSRRRLSLKDFLHFTCNCFEGGEILQLAKSKNFTMINHDTKDDNQVYTLESGKQFSLVK